MQLFLFASGYFYKSTNELFVREYVFRKVKRLLAPCLVYNLLYGIFTTFLYRFGFSVGEKFSLHSWLISPFLFGSDFKFNSPDWFIAQLFVVEIINVLIRRMFYRKRQNEGKCISFALIALGILATHISKQYELSTLSTLLCRTLFCLSWYAIGTLYRKYEAYDRISNGLYFGIIFMAQLVLLLLNEGDVQGSVVRFSFRISPLEVYTAAATGIAFWLRICKITADRLDDNPVVTYIGKHTLSIVENQYLGIFLLNTLLLFIHRGTMAGIGFVEERYFKLHNYIFLYKDSANFAILYLLFGLGVPLLLSYCKELMATYLYGVFKREKHGSL